MNPPIRARFGRFALDAYNPSNMEILFEFLSHFDEVPLPDDTTYRLKNQELQFKSGKEWIECSRSVNYFVELVSTMISADWEYVYGRSVKDNVLDFNKKLST